MLSTILWFRVRIRIQTLQFAFSGNVKLMFSEMLICQLLCSSIISCNFSWLIFSNPKIFSIKNKIIPKIKYQNRTEISQKNLVSLIAANLCGAYLKKNNFTKAIPLALSRMNYLQTESEQIKNDARNDLDIIFTNYTIVLENKNQYETSLNFLQDCINTVGTTQKLTDTYSLTLYNAIVYELNNKN